MPLVFVTAREEAEATIDEDEAGDEVAEGEDGVVDVGRVGGDREEDVGQQASPSQLVGGPGQLVTGPGWPAVKVSKHLGLVHQVSYFCGFLGVCHLRVYDSVHYFLRK